MARKSKESEEEDETVPKSDDRLTNLLASKLMEKIKDKHGDSILMRASDFKVQERPRISTGVFPLDYALGGGFPAGLISTVYGDKSSSKTTTFLRTIKNAQNMCSTCYHFIIDAEWGCKCSKARKFVIAYLDVEGTLDIPWAKSIGVDTDQMIISVPEYAEQTLDIAEALIRSGECDILVIDSIAYLTPAKEIEESAEKGLMGAQPRLVGTGIRKFVAASNAVGNQTGRRPTIFFTNQIRYKLGLLFGNPETTPGGTSPGFASATETRTSQKKTEMNEETGKPISVEIHFKIIKNKTSGAKMEGEYKLMVSDTADKKKGDVCDEDYIVEQALRSGYITRAGGYECNGETFKVKEDLIARLVKDQMFKARTVNGLMPVLLK